jgi:predicted ATP-grasp superfamily ATP-dependent carboligase
MTYAATERRVDSETEGEVAGPPRGRAVGAVVIGGDYQGLGIVRSLGRRGWPVCVIDDERSIARFSRWTTHAISVPDLRGEDATVAELLRAGRTLGLDGWVLYPTREETVAALSRNRERLEERFRVPTPAWETIRVAWDKRETYRRAEELGISAPRTWYPREAKDLVQIDTSGPFVIKPAIKEHFVYETKAKAWRADEHSDLERLFDRARQVVGDGEVMVQELIPGDGRDQVAYCAFFKDGRAIGRMTARRRRQHPPEFGRASTYVETIDLPEIVEPAERLLRAIGYYGLVEVEFKRDARDGGYRLLDVNARTWGYHTLGQSAGVDFPAMLMADQLGEPVSERAAVPGVRWIRLVTDLPTAAVEIAAGRLSVRDYVRSLLQSDAEAVLSRDDPLPGLAEIALVPYLAIKRGF